MASVPGDFSFCHGIPRVLFFAAIMENNVISALHPIDQVSGCLCVSHHFMKDHNSPCRTSELSHHLTKLFGGIGDVL